MSYPYSQINRLEEPHNYMYTPFQGEALLRSYRYSRVAIVHHGTATEQASAKPDHMFMTYAVSVLERLFDVTSPGAGKQFLAMLEGGGSEAFRQKDLADGSFTALAKIMEGLSIAESTPTLDLLHALIAVQLNDTQDANTKTWIDRLVQRFEVTKKIYESYAPGFRKGEGVNTSIRLYWLFALVLCLYYVRSRQIKYLSTLLKTCDLLCSLPESIVQKEIPAHGLTIVLAAEIVSVQLLAEEKGVSFAFE